MLLGTTAVPLPVKPREPLLDVLDRVGASGGTASPVQAIRAHAAGHDRVVVLTHPDRAAESAEAVTGPGQEHVITDVTPG